MIAEAALLLLTGVPLLLAMLVLLPASPSAGFSAGFGVDVGIAVTTAGVGMVYAARGLGRGSAGARRVVIAVQVALLLAALISVPLHVVAVWPIWVAMVLAACLVLYALLLHPGEAAPAAYLQSDWSIAVKRSAMVTVGKVMGISAAIVVVVVLAAMALLTTVFLVVLHGFGRSG